MKSNCKLLVIILSGLMIFLLGTTTVLCQGQNSTPLTLSFSGWTITADSKAGVLTLHHDSLGLVLKEITLNAEKGDESEPLRVWTAEKTGVNQLTLITAGKAPMLYSAL